VRELRSIELARLKKESLTKKKKKKKKKEEEEAEEEKQFGRFAAVWLGTFAMISCAIGSLVGRDR